MNKGATYFLIVFFVCFFMSGGIAYGASPGLPFTEDFTDNSLMDPAGSRANWSEEEEKVYLSWRRTHYNTFLPGDTGSDITADSHTTYDIEVGDVDGDGDLDVVAGNYSAQANRLFLNNGTADPFSGVTGSDITADFHDTIDITLGDVDGDGDLDVVAGNYSAQANRLYLNNGTADPFSGVTGSDITADGDYTHAIGLGDVDGDGDLDVVVGNVGSTNRLYLNNGTTDPFIGVTGSDITSDFHDTIDITLGDVDGDGDLDVVAGNYSAQANRLYLNNGTADPFSGATGSDITADGDYTHAIGLGDVDGDGDLDVVVGNINQANRLYLNNGTADPFIGVTGSDITSDFHDTIDITLGDVDGDGDLDVVAGNYSAQANRLYLNNGTADPFIGVTGSDITADAHNTLGIGLGDVDGDGDLDVVVGNNGVNRLYLNNGTADPFSGVTGSDITADAHNTLGIGLGDGDGDGDLDVVVGNNGVNRLYLNNGTADPFSGVTGSDITANSHTTYDIEVGDVDGDGDLDVVAGNYSAQTNRLYLNNGTADPFSGVTGSDITADFHDTIDITLGDVDGDGDLDVVAGNYSAQANRLYLNNGTADPFSGVTGSDITADGDYTHAIGLGDVDGDGDLDVVVGNINQANRLYLNNGTTDPFIGVTGSDITSDFHDTIDITLGDVDGDGDLDVVAGNYSAQANRLYLNNGTADPFSGATGSDITADGDYTHAIGLGDVDGDGDLDVVVGNINQANRLYLNNGTADPFIGVTGSDITSDFHDTIDITLGDVDGDGDLDVVAGNYSAQANRLYLNNGTADPFIGVTGSDITADAHNTLGIGLGDVDGDGDLDVVVGNNGVNRLYLNNGTADPFSGVTGSDITANSHTTYDIEVGDVDGDGDLDVVAGNYSAQANRLYLNNGTADPFSGVTGSDITSDAHNTLGIGLGDVDGDGDLDVVAGNYSAQANRLYLNNGTADPFSGVTGSDITADAHNTYAIGLGDVDGDGDLDVVAGNINQANRLYLNNGTADPFIGVTGSDITADAHNTLGIGLGDVDGDGDLDVVAGNYSAQANRLYLNNGTADPFSEVTGSDITSDDDYTHAIGLGDVDGDGDLDVVVGNVGSTNRLYLNNGTTDPFIGVTGSDITSDFHDTIDITLGDVDGDGDLDVVAGNYSAQANRLYMNNGTADPFSGSRAVTSPLMAIIPMP